MTTFFVFLGIVVVLVVLGVTIYNRLVTLRERFKNMFAQIDVQMKRRYDLIPNLVETAKGYMSHERETLEAVIKARNQALNAEQKVARDPGDPGAMAALQGAETMLSGALSRFFALSESYPDLKADTVMREVMEELRTTENKIAFARQAFNDAVTEYNVARARVPAVFFAGALGFQAAELFEVDSYEEREAVRVSF